jgi:hypothetical protein
LHPSTCPQSSDTILLPSPILPPDLYFFIFGLLGISHDAFYSVKAQMLQFSIGYQTVWQSARLGALPKETHSIQL